MGAVYRMRHPRRGVDVAVKVLAAHVGSDPGVRARFEREARLTAALRHPNIIRLHDCGTEGENPWLAMDFIEGRDAARLLEEGPLAIPRALEIVRQAAAGLDHAHRQGILHRDVKPANLLITDRSGALHVLIGDFGIARGLDDTHTLTGATRATLAYAPPEQIDGKPVDHRADVYALGCTLYHLLAGEIPFPAPTAYALMHAHFTTPPPRLSTRRPGLPAAVDEVIATALAKDPADRYPSCGALAEAAATALASSNGAVAHWNSADSSADTSVRPTEVLIGVAGSSAERESVPRSGAPGESVTVIVPDPGRRAAVELPGHWGRVQAIAFSASGSRVATGGEDGAVRIFDGRTGAPVGGPLPGFANAVCGLAFGPDETVLAATGWDRTVRIWDIDSGLPIGEPMAVDSRRAWPEFSPDGRLLLTSDRQGAGVRNLGRGQSFADIEHGSARSFPDIPHGSARSVAVDPDGETVAVVSTAGVLELYSGAGERLWVPRQLARPGTDLARFAPDGRALLTVTREGAQLWDHRGALRDRSARPLVELSMDMVGFAVAAFSPDGSRFAVANHDRALVRDLRAEETVRLPLPADGSGVRSIAFGADGALLAVTMRKELRLWDIDARRQLTGRKWSPPVAFAPDGHTVAIAQQDRVLLCEVRDLR